MERQDYDNMGASGSEHSSSTVNDRTPLLRGSRKMPEKMIGVSQQTLVSNDGLSNQGKKLPQYIAALSVTLGALAFGTALAWSSAAGENGVTLAAEYGIPISASEFSWIGSISNLGSATICVPIGLLMNIFGRKRSMLALVVPFTIGWGLIIWANSVTMFYIGRFLTGFSGGAFCVSAPLYTAEIAETEIRGALGSYFQLLLTVGILFSYVLGSFVNMFTLSLVSAIIPLIFFAVFFFMPETPVYHLMKDDEDAARASLVRLRGPRYNVEQELQMQKDILAEAARNKTSFISAMRGTAAKKGLVIAFGLMAVQQLSGVNAIIFYTGTIFTSSSLSTAVSTIIVGVIQVVAVASSTLVVDRLGRKILLTASAAAMTVSEIILGVYYYLEYIETDVSSFTWVPLVCVCIFILMFNFGFGPIPWTMMGEIFSQQVKGIAGSSACLFNWILAFLVTRFYSDLVLALGNYATFWIFGGVCALGTLFSLFIVPETKGKSLDDIQRELGGRSASPRDAGKA